MTRTSSNTERIKAYRAEVLQSYRFKDTPKASYILANIALEELKMATERAEEPDQIMFDQVAYRFDVSADANDGMDQLASLRSRLLKAWIRPIVWSDIINIGTLSSGEAKRVAHNVCLGESADATAEVAADALGQFDEIDERPQQLRSEADIIRMREISGFLGEATPILLGSRHTTAKQFAIPSMAYDDSVNTDISQHIDGIYYDNRNVRQKPRMPYQAETVLGQHSFIDKSIPIIDARLMGTLPKSSRWPHDDRRFVTTRHLVEERRGAVLQPDVSSRIDSISSAVFNKIMNHQ